MTTSVDYEVYILKHQILMYQALGIVVTSLNLGVYSHYMIHTILSCHNWYQVPGT